MKKVCGILSTILLILLLVLALSFVGPMLFGFKELAVLSGSMEPAIPVGSIVYVDDDVNTSELQVGDIVTYYLDSNTFVTHRVVSIDTASQTLVTQGDANTVADGDITFSQIYGRVAFHLPYIGYISTNIRTPAGIMTVSAVVAVIIMLNILPAAFDKSGEEGKKKNEDGAEKSPPEKK